MNKKYVIILALILAVLSIFVLYQHKDMIFKEQVYEKSHTWVMNIQTNKPPVADFSYSINGLTISYTDKSHDPDGNIVSWLWYLGDGTTTTEKNPTHTYPSEMAGHEISVNLMVTDNEGEKSSITKYIKLPKSETFTLNVLVLPYGSGIVVPSGGVFKAGSKVTLTATPNNRYVFSYWSGDATGSQNPFTITMDSNKTIYANFKKINDNQYTVNAKSDPSGGGTIKINPEGGVYNYGSIITLTANPNNGYHFKKWGGDVKGTSNIVTLTIDGNKTVIAYFEKTPSYHVDNLLILAVILISMTLIAIYLIIKGRK